MTYVGIPKNTKPTPANRSLAWLKTAVWPAVANHNEVRRVQLGAPETTRNTWPNIVSQVLVHRISSPYYTRGAFSDPEVLGNFQPSGCTVLGGCLKRL